MLRLMGLLLGCLILSSSPIVADPAIDVALVQPAAQEQGNAPVSFEEKHRNAAHIFLLYDEQIVVKPDWSYVVRVHKKVKILKEASLEMGEVPIQYNKAFQKITDFKAATITPDGKRHAFTRSQDLPSQEDSPMYSDDMIRMLTLPNVTIGSVLDIEYTISAKGMPFEKAFWYTNDLNANTPMTRVIFSLTCPKSLAIAFKEFNLSYKPAITETPTSVTYHWDVKDVFDDTEPEEYLPPPSLDMVREAFEFSSIKSWADVAKWYNSLVEKNLRLTPKIEIAAKTVTEDMTTVRAKVRAVLQHLQKNFRYVSMSFGTNSMEPHPTDEIFANKYGDCKDLSLLTVTMLKAVGVNASIALFARESDITDPKDDLPIPSLFNHAVVLVRDPQEGDFYVDPLLNGYDINEFPLSYQQAYTFVINGQGGEFGRFPVLDDKSNMKRNTQKQAIEPDGSAIVEIDTLFDLEQSIQIRSMMKEFDDQQRKRVEQAIEQYLTEGMGQVIEKRFDGLDALYGPVTAHAKTRRFNVYPVTDGLMIIELPSYGRDEAFTRPTRKHPMFWPVNALKENSYDFLIPPGFEVLHMPSSIDLDMGFLALKRTYERQGSEIKVKETERQRRTLLPPAEFENVKKSLETLAVKTRQRIILKRIEPGTH